VAPGGIVKTGDVENLWMNGANAVDELRAKKNLRREPSCAPTFVGRFA